MTARTRRPHNPHDFYETPAWCVRAILPHLPASSEVLDPCAGNGALLDVLRTEGHDRDSRAIEIDPERRAEAQRRGHNVHREGDALALSPGAWANPHLIIMNPPFSLAQEFVERALAERHPRGTVAALLRLGFLASAKRAAFHQAYPSDVYVLPKRPSFTPDGRTDASDYCWLVWGPGRGGRWQVLEVSDGP